MWIPVTFYIVIIALALIRPYLGLVGLVASLLIRFQDRFTAIESIPTFQIVTVAVIAGMIIHREKLNKPELKMDRLIGWFAGFSLLGILIMEPSEAFKETKELISSVVIYYFVTRLVTSRQHLVGLLLVVVVVTTGLAFESLTSYFGDPGSPFSDSLSGRLQGIGYYANANSYGKLMCTAIPFAAIFLIRGTLFVRMAALAAITIMTVTIGETLSRTCFVTLAVVIASAIMLRGSGQIFRKAAITGIFGIIILYGLTYVPGPVQERAQSIVEYSTDDSFQGRVRAWNQGLDMVSWYPVFGVGKGQWYEYHGLAPHNSYIQVLAETGIPGFILFMSIVWAAFKNVTGHLARTSDKISVDLRIVSLAIASSYCGYLFYILLGNQGYSPWTYFYFGICGVTAFLVSEEAGDASVDLATSSTGPTARRVGVNG